MVKSNFKRLAKDRYWTQPWVTSALLRAVPEIIKAGTVWEPAAGRGDMARVLVEAGAYVLASDTDLSEFDDTVGADKMEIDFLKLLPSIMHLESVITNPPYNKAVQFIRHALEFDVRFVAMLMRSEFKSAAGRVDLFTESNFYCEVVLTKRPRWDWWFREHPEASPRHNFSWFVWDKEYFGEPIMKWEGDKPCKK